MKLPTDWVFRDQWHLRNRVSGEFDIDVVGAWSPAEGPGYTGDGVRAVVIDDGFDYDHPDLRDNYNRRRDADYALGTDDPFGNRKNEHGTAVAGLIAAAADGWGAVGVAYDAEIVGYRVAFNDPAGDLQIARGIADAATGGRADVINLSLGQVDLPWFGEGLPRNVDQAYARAVGVAVEEGRGGLGTTLAKSAGNDREDGYDVNADIWNNDTRQVIVAGVERDGSVSSYSNFGAALLVSAFGTDWEVVTTDRTGRAGYQPGDYTYFAGTSAAAPMVTGVVALMLEAEDGLGWRDVQSILAASARHVGTRIGGAPRGDERFGWDWNGAATWNGGGQHFSNDYGYGLVDARAAVRLAETWLATGAPAATSATEVATELDLLDTPETLPRGTGMALEVGGTVGTDDLVERVLVTIDVEASRMQDLIATITAPSGTTSALIAGAGDGPFDGRWTLESQAFRGERAGGIWTVSLDRRVVQGRDDRRVGRRGLDRGRRDPRRPLRLHRRVFRLCRRRRARPRGDRQQRRAGHGQRRGAAIGVRDPARRRQGRDRRRRCPLLRHRERDRWRRGRLDHRRQRRQPAFGDARKRPHPRSRWRRPDRR